MGGEGGGGTTCQCLSTQVCTPDDERCVSKFLIDDFVICDDEILAIEGRSGAWYGAADDDVDLTVGFGDPGPQWVDHSCAAYAVGSVVPEGTATEFAFLGVTLNDGAPYNLAAYGGLDLLLESEQPVQVVLKTAGGGSFSYTLPAVVGSTSRMAPFASMVPTADSAEAILDLTTVTEIQFAAPDRAGFGFAIHRLGLYQMFSSAP